MNKPIRTEVEGIPILAAGPYYEGDNKMIAKRIKEGDLHALECAARSMVPLIPKDSVLVPIPGHQGTANQTYVLCMVISHYTGLPVANVLKGKERQSNYIAKHEGRGLTEKDMGIRQISSLPDHRTPVFIDNCVDTATTAKAAYHAVGRGVVVAFAMSDTLLKDQNETIKFRIR